MKRLHSVVGLTCTGCLLAALCLAAGTVTDTKSGGSIRVDTIAWTITTNANINSTIQGIDGQILRVVFAAQATTNEYDVLLNDGNGIDLLQTQGVDLSNAVYSISADNADTVLPIATFGDVTLIITNYTGLSVAATTNGSLVVYWR